MATRGSNAFGFQVLGSSSWNCRKAIFSVCLSSIQLSRSWCRAWAFWALAAPGLQSSTSRLGQFGSPLWSAWASPKNPRIRTRTDCYGWWSHANLLQWPGMSTLELWQWIDLRELNRILWLFICFLIIKCRVPMLRCPGFRRFPNVLDVAMACGSARFIHAAFSVGTSNADQQGTGSTGHSYGATRSVMSRFQFHTMGVLWGFQNASMQQKTTCFRGAGNAAAMYKFQQASIFVDTSRKTRGVVLEVLDASCRFFPHELLSFIKRFVEIPVSPGNFRCSKFGTLPVTSSARGSRLGGLCLVILGGCLVTYLP